MHIPATLVRSVLSRADHACEYCLVRQADDIYTFELDHVIPLCHGGETSLDNLAYSCWHCNCFKGANVAGIDPERKRVVRLFHPRRENWSDHFRWDGGRIEGRTGIGRVTEYVLRLNLDVRILLRAALIAKRRIRRT